VILARRVASLALLAAVVVVAILILDSGGSSYQIKMRLSDADGLRQGSPVSIGGQDVGTISMSVRNGRVLVDMKLDRAQAPVGKDATASVASVNLLGQKRVELYKGNIHDPAPSGYVLPAGRVTVTTDLDQVFDTLTPDVRARLAILINEAGLAFTGRRADFNQMLAQLPPDFNAGTQLLSGISTDNHTLAALVQNSDGFISQLAGQRAQLVHLVKVLGQASSTVAAKRAQLAATLERAPGTLATLRRFLVKLQSTTVPLGPAAVDITHTAPVLNQTLAQLEPFRQAAEPTLREATSVAPDLTRLAVGATPVIRQATPVIASLATFAEALQPISSILNGSADNLVAILQNWSDAIQFRDGLSHVFRGEATSTPQIVESMVNQLEQSGLVPSLHRAASSLMKLEHGASGSTQQSSSSASTGSSSPAGTTAATPAASAGSPSASAAASPPVAGSGTGSSSPTGSSGSAPASGGPLGSLLSFLLKP
jgi:phospholipid/cholesterol/gamma-HCH transport system substrate-binding protein